MTAVSAYAGERAGKDPKGTAHAATWLNGARWTDEPAPGFVPEQRRNGRLGGWTGFDQSLAMLVNDLERETC